MPAKKKKERKKRVLNVFAHDSGKKKKGSGPRRGGAKE